MQHSNDSRPEERAEYVAIRDTCKWLEGELYNGGQIDQAIHLGQLFKTFMGDC